MKGKVKKSTADDKVISVEVIITYSSGEKGTVSILDFFSNKENLMSRSSFDDYLNEKSDTTKLAGKFYAKVPVYSFFCEVEDGLMYIKGVNKEMLVGTVDEVRWPRAEKQYAMYLLKNDNDLTEDDKVVLNKIIEGTI